MYTKELFSYWIIAGLVLITLGAVLDAGSFATEQWGNTEKDYYYTYMGLFKVCNGTRSVTRRDKLEIFRLDPVCIFPTELNLNWYLWTIGMESMGIICTGMAVFTMVAFLLTLRQSWIKSRSALVALIPITILAACFNLTGVVVFAHYIGDLENSTGYSVIMDALAICCFAIGVFLCVMDLQGICMKNRPTVGKGLTRPI